MRLLSLLPVLLVALASAVCGSNQDEPQLFFNGSDKPVPSNQIQNLNQTRSIEDIELTLSKAAYSADATLFMFELVHTGGAEVIDVRIPSDEIEITGVDTARPVLPSGSRFQSHVTIEAGALAEGASEVTISVPDISYIVGFEGDAGESGLVGPWVFRFKPDPTLMP
jgi:hypothetical protein